MPHTCDPDQQLGGGGLEIRNLRPSWPTKQVGFQLGPHGTHPIFKKDLPHDVLQSITLTVHAYSHISSPFCLTQAVLRLTVSCFCLSSAGMAVPSYMVHILFFNV